ncbi:MAG: sensor histidine kinase [Anaerolineae bacterium]
MNGASWDWPQFLERMEWMVRLRWMAVGGTLAALALANLFLPGVLPLVLLAGVTVAIGLYNLIFYLFVWAVRLHGPPRRLWGGPDFLMHAQISLDLAALTLLLHYAGGAENPFFPYYVFHVTLAAIVLSRGASFLYAALASALYAGMVWLEYAGWIGHVHLLGLVDPDLYRREVYLIATTFALSTTAFFAALVVGGLARQLRERERELLASNQACELRSAELAALNRRLQELDKAKTSFMLMVTHELRAPLAAIQSYLQLILKGYTSPEDQRHILERASERAAELLDLIADLLELSQARAQPAEAALQWVHPDDILQEVVQLLRGQAQEKGLTLQVTVDEDLPQVHVAPRDMRAVWTNLISNAIKYTEPGGKVTVSLQRDEEGLRGSVQDTGIGIPPEEMDRIFSEFFRASNARATGARGTGLGLSIVKRLVENYGGRIWVESSPGKGSTFTFLWPVAQVEGAVALQEKAQVQEVPATQVGER